MVKMNPKFTLVLASMVDFICVAKVGLTCRAESFEECEECCNEEAYGEFSAQFDSYDNESECVLRM